MSQDRQTAPLFERGGRARQDGLSRRSPALAASALLAGCSALIGGVLLAPPSAAVPVDFSVTFPDLLPGEVRTERAEVTLDRGAVLDDVAWVRTDGLLATAGLGVEVCGASGCATERGPRDLRLPAGTLDVFVTVRAPESLEPDARGSALGRLTFVDADDELASTGSPATTVLVWSGALLLACGTLLTVGSLARRAGSSSPGGAS